MPATLLVSGVEKPLTCRALVGSEALGRAPWFEVDVFSPEVIDPRPLAGKICMLEITSDQGGRLVPGIVASVAAIATTRRDALRHYRVTLRGTFAALELRRRSRIFQHLSVPEIVKTVLQAVFSDDCVKQLQQGSYAPRDYVAQYAETDADFVRRLCEEEGLYFHFAPAEAGEAFVLEDSSTAVTVGPPDPLVVTQTPERNVGTLWASSVRVATRRRPGKVTLRDYDQAKPALTLEATVAAGTSVEQGLEVYEAPGRFTDKVAGKKRATVRLESLRALAETITFQSNAVGLAPGMKVSLERSGHDLAVVSAAGDHFVTALRHAWNEGADRYVLHVEAIPLATPFRLPRVTPRPRVHGVHRARVTGPSGSEVHTDDQGRVNVHFFWDREGTTDEKSSLPIRAMQPNTPGSMNLPRVSWEAIVAFEDSDPDRPYVLGRMYDGKYVPPQSLPKNKTVTCIRTYSSPGGGGINGIQFDDASGSQHMTFAASFGKSTSVANNMFTQTAKNENLAIGASQSTTIGANDDVSVTEKYLTAAASQSASVGGSQKIFVKGDMSVGVGSETVMIGGALLEKVGNPVAGAAALAKAAALDGVGSLGAAGAAFAKGAGMAEGLYNGYQHGGVQGALGSVADQGLGMAAGMIPGGDAIMASVNDVAGPMPWHRGEVAPGDAAGGGGAAGASGGSGAGGPGPGHRKTIVKGAYTELIGAVYGVVTPGKIGWNTTGASTFLVGATHSTRTAAWDSSVMGASIELLGSLKIDTAGDLAREITGALNTTIAGALKSSSVKHGIDAGAALSIKTGGAMKLDASEVQFVCGGTKVTAKSDGVTIEATTIKIDGKTTQSGKTNHA